MGRVSPGIASPGHLIATERGSETCPRQHVSDDHKQLTALDLGARRETSENAQLGHRLQLTIGTCGEPLYDRVWQDTLAFADLDEVVAELAQLLGHYRARQALHLDLALSQPRS